MNEIDILLSHAADMKERAADDSIVTHTNFLSTDEISEISKISKHLSDYVDTFFYGGYAESERCICVFVPKFYEFSDLHSFFIEQSINPIAVVKVKKDKFCTLTHRDYLGAIMSLGIKREMIGDIVINNDGCFVFALKSIAPYLCENLERAGRGTLKCNIVSFEQLTLTEENTVKGIFSVASLRLDNFICAVFNLSRKTASESIQKGIVFVNSVKALKNDYIIKPGDKIVFRGKGKAVFSEKIGESRRGKVRIAVKKYK